MAKRYHDKRNALINELGAQCSMCGTKEGPFDIDHISWKRKKMRAADVHSVNEEAVNKEKKNFQLLCKDCHKTKTSEDLKAIKKRLRKKREKEKKSTASILCFAEIYELLSK